MKTIKYFNYILLSGFLLSIALTSCSDDDSEDPPRLFRPIVSLVNNGNTIVASWDQIKGATSFELELHKAGDNDENGNPVYSLYREATVSSSPYSFEGVEWDEKYIVKIKAVGDQIESAVYESDDLSVIYITQMTGIRSIDVAALILWKTEGTPITYLKVEPVEGGETVEATVSPSDFESGQKEIYGLQPNTSYKVWAYSGEEQTGNTYAGSFRFTTSESVDLDKKYGQGKYIDLRSESDADILFSEEILSLMKKTEGLALILQGGFEYKVNNSIVFEKSVTYTTGLSLSGNAVFVQSGGFRSAANATIDYVRFENIDIISDKAYAKPVREYTAKSFDGRQVYNVNGTNSVVNEITFSGCRIEGYRAIVRLQGADGAKNVLFSNCTINGIGDQGAVTTNNGSSAVIENVLFKNSTLLNIVMLCDLRASKTAPKLQIADCTFCYAPIETTENANTPLLRLGSNPLEVSISNTIFGPSMATDNSAGANLQTYHPGTAGSILLNASAATISFDNSFKTNFGWTEVNGLTYPLEGLENISTNETTLFDSPSEENFTIRYNFSGAKTAGASSWRMP